VSFLTAPLRIGSAAMPRCRRRQVFENVEVLRRDLLGVLCRMAGKRVFVVCAVMLMGTTIQFIGERGRLVVPRGFAEEQRLL